MSLLKEAFTNLDTLQTKFYNSQQVRYQEVEPNRFLSDKMKGDLNPSIILSAQKEFSKYDPYTNKTKTNLSGVGISKLLQGQPPVTEQEEKCRSYIGFNGLQQLINDQANNPNTPVRCGWRYKKSTGGLVPEISQGALGTINGPLNNNATQDSLGNGVSWIWNLDTAKRTILRDIANSLPTGSALAVLPSIQGGVLTNQLGYCTTTQRIIPINNGSAAYPDDKTLNCASSNIITDVSKLPDSPTYTNGIQALQTTSIQPLIDCSQPGSSASLSRDCLLQAIKNNGCSDKGTLYQSLQLANPSAKRWDEYLDTRTAYLDYQSRQGGNGITKTLFEKDQGNWETAISEINRLYRTTMTAVDPHVRIASQDLCLQTGTYDNYDFCSDIADNTDIATVDLKCLQNHWQSLGGKPAGTFYPTSKNLTNLGNLRLDNIKKIYTWSDYKTIIQQFKDNVNSSDPILQRRTLEQFYGVNVSTVAFSPKNIGGLVFWLDANDGSTLTINERNAVIDWTDKVKNIKLTQTTKTARPTYNNTGGMTSIQFTPGKSFSIPNAYSLVSGYFSVFIVEKRASSEIYNFMLTGTNYSRNNNLIIGYNSNTSACFSLHGNDVYGRVEPLKSANEPYRIWCCTLNNSGRQLWLNGSLIASDRNNTLISSWENAFIGEKYTGNICEILFYNPSISDNGRVIMEGYLAAKWGLQEYLPTGHAFKNFSP